MTITKNTGLIPIFLFLILMQLSCGTSVNHIYSNKILYDAAGEPINNIKDPNGYVVSEKYTASDIPADSIDSIENHTLGRFWLEFSKSGENKENLVEIPVEVADEINSFFRFRINFCISSNKADKFSSKENIERDMDLLTKSNKLNNRLLETKINAPDGIRKMSRTEADRFIEYVTKSALNVCRKNINKIY